MIVNGDVKTGEDAKRALEETGCAGVMIGRAAIDHPWVFREARSMVDRGVAFAGPTLKERFDFCRAHLIEQQRAWRAVGVSGSRVDTSAVTCVASQAAALRNSLNICDSLEGCFEILADAERRANGTTFAAAAV